MNERLNMQRRSKLNHNVERDFVPIVLVGVTPKLLIANPAQPALTVKDIVALCKAKPGQVSFGSAQHLALEMFKLQAKVVKDGNIKVDS